MAAGSTQRQFDPGITNEDESFVNDCNKMLNKVNVIHLFIERLRAMR